MKIKAEWSPDIEDFWNFSIDNELNTIYVRIAEFNPNKDYYI